MQRYYVQFALDGLDFMVVDGQSTQVQKTFKKESLASGYALMLNTKHNLSEAK